MRNAVTVLVSFEALWESRPLWLQKNIPNLLLFQELDYGSYSAVDNNEENNLSKLQQMQLI